MNAQAAPRIHDPRALHEYARAHIVEQIMALVGAQQPNPRLYRDYLESLHIEKLRETYALLIETLFESARAAHA